MSASYDPASTTGKIRLLITDIDLSVTTGNREDFTIFFTDEEITEFWNFALGAGDAKIFRAAAHALRSIAVSRALIARMIRIGSYQEDTKGASEILNAKAKEYDDIADKIEGPYSSYVSYDWTSASLRARLWREAILGL